MGYKQTCKLSRHVVQKEKEKVILSYMRENWDVVLNSSVSMMKTLPFKTRLRFAMDIALANRKKAFKAIRGGDTIHQPPGRTLGTDGKPVRKPVAEQEKEPQAPTCARIQESL
jgi:hypothetical protein